MDYSTETAPLEELQCDCMIVGVYQDQQLSPSAAALNNSTEGLIANIVNRGDLSGKNGEVVLINAIPNNKIERVLLVGLGENKPLSAKNYKKALLAAINSLKKPQIKSIVCCLAECEVEGRDWQWKSRHIIEVFNDAIYQFTHTKSDKETESKIEKISIFAPESERALAHSGLMQGKAVAEGMALTKHLGDLPGNICTPTYLAGQAVELGKQYNNLTVKILEE
ncbi:MAG: M17 family peptidase N-terminal domain-containing protein, partial [Methylobacter sp.]